MRWGIRCHVIDVIIARYWNDETDDFTEVSVGGYEKMLASAPPDKVGIAKMVFHRFETRYIRPYSYADVTFRRKHQSGFALMASGSLLIEAIESFRNG